MKLEGGRLYRGRREVSQVYRNGKEDGERRTEEDREVNKGD